MANILGVKRILLVEDDKTISEPLGAALEREGYEVVVVRNGEVALRSLGGVDLMLLDLGLPDVDGVDLCRNVRARDSSLPIVILTARAAELDAVVGLDAGADDYVTKPFRLAELVARIRSVLRRSSGTTYGDVRVDEKARRAWMHDRELELTPKEFDLLSLLLHERGNAVRRDRIMRDVWQGEWFGSTKTLDVHISSLRRKLNEDERQPPLLTTVRGVGYRLETEA